MNFLKRKSNDDEPKGKRQKYVLPDNQEITLNTHNLVPVVLQDAQSGEVLHLGYMDKWALNSSLERRIVYLYRRSKGRLEAFGSKNNLEYEIKRVKLDKSHRSLLMLVSPNGNGNIDTSEAQSFTSDVAFK